MISIEMAGLILTVAGVAGERVYNYGRSSRTVEALEKKDDDQEDEMKSMKRELRTTAVEFQGAINSVRNWQEMHTKEETEIRIQMERDLGMVRNMVAGFESKLDSVLNAIQDLKKTVEKIKEKN